MQDHIRPPTDESLLKRFDYCHLTHGPERELAASYAMIADLMAETLPISPNVTRSLRALLDARQELDPAA